jgi:hypothetical protein
VRKRAPFVSADAVEHWVAPIRSLGRGQRRRTPRSGSPSGQTPRASRGVPQSGPVLSTHSSDVVAGKKYPIAMQASSVASLGPEVMVVLPVLLKVHS